jgi:hypothetical protein
LAIWSSQNSLPPALNSGEDISSGDWAEPRSRNIFASVSYCNDAQSTVALSA